MKSDFSNPNRFALTVYAVAALIALLVYSKPSAAEEGLMNLYAEIGVETGGAELVSIRYDDGYVEDLNAGDGFAIAVGTAYYLPTASFQGTIGFKSDSVEARNSDTLAIERFRFERIKFDGLAFHHHQRHAIGAGLTWHTNIGLDAPDGETFDAENALGFVAEYRFYLTNNAHLGLRYTDIDYSLEGTENQVTRMRGNALGFYLGGSF